MFEEEIDDFDVLKRSKENVSEKASGSWFEESLGSSSKPSIGESRRLLNKSASPSNAENRFESSGVQTLENKSEVGHSMPDRLPSLGEGGLRSIFVKDPLLPVFLLRPSRSLSSLLGRLPSRLRPGRLITKYSHFTPRLAHREHAGFSLRHFTLDTAQAWQLSRSLAFTGSVGRRAVIVD